MSDDTPRACPGCGKQYRKKPGPGRWPLSCEACRKSNAGQPTTPIDCVRCGETFTPLRRTVNRRFCPACRKHNRKGAAIVICEFCGESKWTQAPQSYCSRSCARRARAGWSTCTDLVHVPTKPSTTRRTPDRPVVIKASGGVFVQGSCHLCSTPFTSLTFNGKARFCSLRCGRRYSEDKRRATKRNAYVADVRRLSIYERDGWRCKLCGKKVRPTAEAPHPLAPVLDHIIPLAVGGTHEPANVQCAHFLCNSRKGDRAANDQLLLLG